MCVGEAQDDIASGGQCAVCADLADGIVGDHDDDKADGIVGPDGIVGARGDMCLNNVTNICIRRESFARPVRSVTSSTGTTGSRRGSAGRRMATTLSPLMKTTRTAASISSYAWALGETDKQSWGQA